MVILSSNENINDIIEITKWHHMTQHSKYWNDDINVNEILININEN